MPPSLERLPQEVPIIPQLFAIRDSQCQQLLDRIWIYALHESPRRFIAAVCTCRTLFCRTSAFTFRTCYLFWFGQQLDLSGAEYRRRCHAYVCIYSAPVFVAARTLFRLFTFHPTINYPKSSLLAEIRVFKPQARNVDMQGALRLLAPRFERQACQSGNTWQNGVGKFSNGQRYRQLYFVGSNPAPFLSPPPTTVISLFRAPHCPGDPSAMANFFTHRLPILKTSLEALLTATLKPTSPHTQTLPFCLPPMQDMIKTTPNKWLNRTLRNLCEQSTPKGYTAPETSEYSSMAAPPDLMLLFYHPKGDPLGSLQQWVPLTRNLTRSSSIGYCFPTDLSVDYDWDVSIYGAHALDYILSVPIGVLRDLYPLLEGATPRATLEQMSDAGTLRTWLLVHGICNPELDRLLALVAQTGCLRRGGRSYAGSNARIAGDALPPHATGGIIRKTAEESRSHVPKLPLSMFPNASTASESPQDQIASGQSEANAPDDLDDVVAACINLLKVGVGIDCKSFISLPGVKQYAVELNDKWANCSEDEWIAGAKELADRRTKSMNALIEHISGVDRYDKDLEKIFQAHRAILQEEGEASERAIKRLETGLHRNLLAPESRVDSVQPKTRQQVPSHSEDRRAFLERSLPNLVDGLQGHQVQLNIQELELQKTEVALLDAERRLTEARNALAPVQDQEKQVRQQLKIVELQQSLSLSQQDKANLERRLATSEQAKEALQTQLEQLMRQLTFKPNSPPAVINRDWQMSADLPNSSPPPESPEYGGYSRPSPSPTRAAEPSLHTSSHRVPQLPLRTAEAATPAYKHRPPSKPQSRSTASPARPSDRRSSLPQSSAHRSTNATSRHSRSDVFGTKPPSPTVPPGLRAPSVTHSRPPRLGLLPTSSAKPWEPNVAPMTTPAVIRDRPPKILADRRPATAVPQVLPSTDRKPSAARNTLMKPPPAVPPSVTRSLASNTKPWEEGAAMRPPAALPRSANVLDPARAVRPANDTQGVKRKDVTGSSPIRPPAKKPSTDAHPLRTPALPTPSSSSFAANRPRARPKWVPG
ncbi:hypothetical protein DFH09DRAFT_1069950 [Mycena vulgaris]|nr:hypothetical protein DFH09DRAFT_1069950 [Mycena vulgaris]